MSWSGALVAGLPVAPSEDELSPNDYHAWIFVAGSHGTVLKSSDAGLCLRRGWSILQAGLSGNSSHAEV